MRMTIVREGNLMDKEAKRKRAWWIGERANVNFTAHINISSIDATHAVQHRMDN